MFLRFLFLFSLLLSFNSTAEEALHVSFDVTRELFNDINRAFIKENDVKVRILQSHGGSGKQVSSIIHGLQANIVSLAISYHMDLLAEKNLVAHNWRELFPNNSSPFSTHIVFLVRKNNPKQIKDWSDLVNSNVKVITPNPKTSGGALWSYASAWEYAVRNYKNPQEYMHKLYHNVPVLDTAARSSATTFIKRKIGDVLITWESEAKYIVEKFDKDFEIIEPSISAKIDIPVAIILCKSHQNLAKQYVNFLFSDKAQEIAKKYYYHSYKELNLDSKNLVNIDHHIKWSEFKNQHFGEDGIFEQIYK